MSEQIITKHMVKGEDLNHHGTLYAGRGVEWMVEAGFIAASSAVGSENIVCMRINSLLFRKPVKKGSIVSYESRIVFAGRTSLTAYVLVKNANTGEFIVDGFFTYIYVDESAKPQPHGIVIEPETEKEKQLFEAGKQLMEEAKREAFRFADME
jgi:acyl-CoA hydrolase